jgi:CubicO group peptidase (beta-lactamase class C family)
MLAGILMAKRKDRISEAESIVRRLTESGEVSGATLLVRQGAFATHKGFGKAKADTVFLLASITKPMTAGAVLLLRDRGLLRLDDPAHTYLPRFREGARSQITIRHLLTHTSGLPDMLPENDELRKRHAPLSEFVERTYKTPLLFEPGTKVQYQSMGILLAAAIAEKVSGQPLPDFLEREVFKPLWMRDTSLGLGGRSIVATAQSQVPQASDWDWNSSYWRDLGAPWGGAHAPAADVARYLEAFRHPESSVWKTGTTIEMTTNQTRLSEPWGLGWSINPSTFGRSCSTKTFGHSGSTGTLAWFDRESGTTMVLLTTKPAVDSEKPLIRPVSDLISDAAKK